MGAICAAKALAERDKEDADYPYLDDCQFTDHGLVCKRIRETLATNLPILRHHSTTGYNCGYGGSGPADLALAVMACALPLGKGDDGVKIFDQSKVSSLAYQLHLAFKFDFIAPMAHQGGHIPIKQIRAWIKAQKSGMEKMYGEN